MKLRSVVPYISVLVIGAMVGVAYDSLSWQYHWYYVGLNWLGPLIGADGERGYDAMLYESAIDFAVGFLFLFCVAKLIQRKRQRVMATRGGGG